MNRRGFFTTIVALLFGTTARPGGRYATDSNAYVPRRAQPGEHVVTFSRDPKKFRLACKYAKVTAIRGKTP